MKRSRRWQIALNVAVPLVLTLILAALAMAFLYYRDALTTDVVRPNVIKGSIWVLLALGTFVWSQWRRRSSRSTA